MDLTNSDNDYKASKYKCTICDNNLARKDTMTVEKCFNCFAWYFIEDLADSASRGLRPLPFLLKHKARHIRDIESLQTLEIMSVFTLDEIKKYASDVPIVGKVKYSS